MMNKGQCYNKIPYFTKEGALIAIRNMRNRRNHRAYSCHLTDKTHYHISSMTHGNYKQKMNKEKMHADKYVQ